MTAVARIVGAGAVDVRVVDVTAVARIVGAGAVDARVVDVTAVARIVGAGAVDVRGPAAGRAARRPVRGAALGVVAALSAACAGTPVASDTPAAAGAPSTPGPEAPEGSLGALDPDAPGWSPPAASELTLELLDGGRVELREHVGRRPVVLAFWATWCRPCEDELERFDALVRTLGEDAVALYAINVDGPEGLAAVRPWVAQRGLALPVAVDPETTLLARFHPGGTLPFYVLFDRQGRVVERHQGYAPGDERQLEARLRALSAEAR